MKAASVSEIKKELTGLDPESVRTIALRLVKHKKENKELVNYLLFEAHDEGGYIEGVKREVDEFFGILPTANLYYAKKSLRKILRFINRQAKYSGIPQTELELRLFFCGKMKSSGIRLTTGTVLFNLYDQQLNKIDAAMKKLPDDLQADYAREREAVKLP
jgi:hypothetical protein